MLKSSCLWSDDSDSRVRLVGAEQAPDFKSGDAAIPLLKTKDQRPHQGRIFLKARIVTKHQQLNR